MGRSSKEQADANRASIVEAASALFRSRKFESVGIADVMRSAGMTQGGFYKHFASKEALAAEAWAFGFRSAIAAWRREARGDAPLASLVDYYLAPKPPERTCPMVAHGEEAARQEGCGALRAVYADGVRGMHEAFREAAEGVLDAERADMLFAAMVGANALGRATGDADWTERLRTAMVEAARART